MCHKTQFVPLVSFECSAIVCSDGIRNFWRYARETCLTYSKKKYMKNEIVVCRTYCTLAINVATKGTNKMQRSNLYLYSNHVQHHPPPLALISTPQTLKATKTHFELAKLFLVLFGVTSMQL